MKILFPIRVFLLLLAVWSFQLVHPKPLQIIQVSNKLKNTATEDEVYDITKILGEHDILIVFSSIISSKEGFAYMANVYGNDSLSPNGYHLFTEEQIADCLDPEKCFYNNPQLYNLLWGNILKEKGHINDIYIIPHGILWNLPVEYIRDATGKMFCENYNVFRLSSLSALTRRDKKKHYSRMSIWGGIDFYSDLTGITRYEYNDSTTTAKCNLGYLEDSYRAAKEIHEELQQRNLKSSFYFDNTATEERFKSEEWDSVDVLFIETHGLKLNNYNMQNIQQEEDPMENHALALAGASYVLEGGIVPDSIDDGILTAKEISELDLSNVDLAVISACKSATGEIREDGVYGLMRGFKQAGARSLIMATDDIVDYVAGQLWIQLFRNLAKGMTKREAFLEGLKYIRTMDDGAFSHPKYWTPFILIDGME